MGNRQIITDAEWEVMRVLWTLDAATSREVSAILKEVMGWEAPTTKTLLGRLVKKGFVKTVKEGKAYRYYPIQTEQNGIINRVDQLFETLCHQEMGSIINHLIEQYPLSHQDKVRLLKTLDAKQTVERVPCNCLENCTCHHRE